MNMMNNNQFLKAKITLIGRLFTLGGNVLFLIDYIITVIAAYELMKQLSNKLFKYKTLFFSLIVIHM